jgi:hypothetical protein
VSAYEHDQKETVRLIASFISYGLAFLMDLIILLVANVSPISSTTKVYLIIAFLILILLLNSVAAVLETFSRVDEQRF